jgi:cytochrome c5
MSEVTHRHDDEGPHEGPIKTPKQLVIAVVFAFLVPIIAIILLVTFVAEDKQPAAGSEGLTPQAIAERIQPVGKVQVRDASDASSIRTGEQVYTAVCSACHGTGTLNAPKFGDSAAWGPRIAQGFQTLLNSALKGKGAMPAQGGGDFSEMEIGRAVVYMANRAGAKFEEPKAQGQAASAPTAGGAPAPVATAGTTGAAAPSAPVNPTPPAATISAEAPATPAAPGTGGAAPALYTQTCSVCHAAGVAGAPKVGDKAAWAPRIAQGINTLVGNAVKGKGAMPPKGGTSASEAELKEVVTYMVNASK